MEVTETAADGLKREFRIVVSAAEIEEKVKSHLEDLGRRTLVPGFRPGRVPLPILKTRFGGGVIEEVRRHAIEEGMTAAMSERNLRLALPPKIALSAQEESGDLEFTMAVELLPEIPETNFADLDIERLIAEVAEEDVDKAIGRIAEQHRQTEPVERPAELGDIIVGDIEARVGDEEIPGGGGENRQIALGSGTSVPGFEEQLVGASAGETRRVEVIFPADYAAESLAGKEAVFIVRVKEVRRLLPVAIDDALAEEVGLTNLVELRQEVRERMQRDWDALARQRLKRALLDKLAERYDFAVPAGLVEIEFTSLWRQYEAAREARKEGEGASAPSSAAGEAAEAEQRSEEGEAEVQEEVLGMESGPEDEGKTEEELKASTMRLAERRVRLGLLLAEVGRSNNIAVSQEELRQAVAREAMRHPGHERRILDFYRKNPEAVSGLQAPILEEKVIDFIVELAKVGERKVALKELLAGPGEDAA
jgi:trigger factor